MLISVPTHANEESVCFGSQDSGRLEHGWQLPSGGKNYTAYSQTGVLLGRNYVHSQVYKVVVDAYAMLETQAPAKVFVYGESGDKDGGKFRPHKTHQNGLSVDFFVPVVDSDGVSVQLPTSILNKWGYGIEFVGSGEYHGLNIDYDAMALHLWTLKASAEKNGVKIWRVIFDNDLQVQLFKSPEAKGLREVMAFSTKKPWVRHDEHYHIDFSVPCQPLS
ncbi:penicillin-insensitive murein endopeptidase [Methylomonas sp. AM2-LC]|uniref:penicillin-insensitive murein endopeptidase n=1 Tax=Methylomonas sp. AM2-LC TaxID=3153301 RepID=UPI003266EEB0